MAGLTAQRPGCGKRAWPLFLIIALVGFVDAQVGTCCTLGRVGSRARGGAAGAGGCACSFRRGLASKTARPPTHTNKSTHPTAPTHTHPSAQPSLLPSTPNWVAAFPKWSGARNASLSYNHEVVAEANASGTVFDVAFYGDSLTALLVLVKENVPVFTQYFGPTWGPTARLGVGGSTVEELAWRILVNGEKLAQDPLVRCQAGVMGVGRRRCAAAVCMAGCMIELACAATSCRSPSCSSASTTR